jgi:hypothetical protein
VTFGWSNYRTAAPGLVYTPATCTTDAQGLCTAQVTTNSEHKEGIYTLTVVAYDPALSDNVSLNPNTANWQRNDSADYPIPAPPEVKFWNDPVCQTPPADSVPLESRTRLEITKNGAKADGTDVDRIKVYAFDCWGNDVENAQIGTTPTSPVQVKGPLPKTGEDGTAVIEYTAVSATRIQNSKTVVTLASPYGDTTPYEVKYFPVGSQTAKIIGDDDPVNTPGSSPAPLDYVGNVPDKPSITEVDDQPVSGPINTNDDTPKIEGTGVPGNTVDVTDGNGNPVPGCTGILVGADGKWECTPTTPFPEGPNTITATQTDPDGQKSPPSDPVEFNVDKTKPKIDITTPEGTTDKPAQINNTTPWTVAGTATDKNPTSGVEEPLKQAPVSVTNKGPNGTPGEVLCTATTDDQGRWSCQVAAGKPGPESDTPYIVEAVVTDKAGNISEPDSVPVKIDNTKPDIKITDPKSNDIFNKEDKPTGSTGVTIPVKGYGENPDDPVVVTVPSGEKCETKVTNTAVQVDGKTRYEWSCTLTNVPDSPKGGTTPITATETDPAGNVGTDTVPVLIDTVPPPAPPVTEPKTGDVIDGTPTFKGTGDEPGNTIKVKDDNGDTICTTTVKSDKTWECEVKDPLPEGKHDFDVTETDPAGNESEPTHVPDVVVAGKPPKPDITYPVDGSKSNDGAPDVKGTIPGTDPILPGSVVQVEGPNGEKCTAQIAADRSWHCKLPDLGADGPKTITATTVDPNGQKSDPDSVTYTLDRTPPTITPDTRDPANIGVKTEPNADVEIKNDDGKTICTAKADSQGNAVCKVTDPNLVPKPGDPIHITATDEAGNTATKTVRIIQVVVTDKLVTLPDEHSQTATGYYFQPGEQVHGVMYSYTPKDLGYQTADSTGKVVFTWTDIPDDQPLVGYHYVVLTGNISGPGQDDFNIERKVTTCVGKSCYLETTGAGVNATFMAGGALATLAGLGFILLAWRRRRDLEEAKI